MRERGFSLIEVVIALLVLTLIITVSLAAFLERNKRLQQANEIILAYQALANEAEYRRRIDFSLLDTSPTTFLSDTTVLGPLEPFAATVKVEQASPGFKNVTMTIRWREGQRDARLTLLRADTGGGQSLW
jgi:prepilin-type N-terminal cleavage/methylation domain-containing protein